MNKLKSYIGFQKSIISRSKNVGEKMSRELNLTSIGNSFLQGFVNEAKSLKFEIRQLVKLIEDETMDENAIIDYFKALLSKKSNENETRKAIQTFRDNDGSGLTDNFSLLHHAARNCHPTLCRFLIEEMKMDKNILTKHKLNALHVLVKWNVFKKPTEHVDFEEMDDEDHENDMVDEYESSEQTNLKKSNLHSKGSIEMQKYKIKLIKLIEYFIEIDINVNQQDDEGQTPLHYSVIYDNYEAALAMTVLAYQKINLEIKDNSTLTPLELACKLGHEDMACLLIDKINILTYLSNLSNSNFALHLACSNKKECIQIVRRMLNRVKKDTFDPIHLPIVLQTLDNTYNQTILNIAMDNNHLQIVDLLLKEYYGDMKHQQDKNGNLPIHLCAKNGSVDLFNILVKNNAVSFGLNSKQENALHIAAENNKYKFVTEFLYYEKNLVDKNAEIRATHVNCAQILNREGLQPLFLAIINGHTKCVEILASLDYAKIDAQDKNGNTIFHACAEYNNQESLRILTKLKDQRVLKALYVKNKKNETVFHVASQCENLEVIKLVLGRIYDGFVPIEIFLKSLNKEGQNFFHLACIKGCFNIIEYILKDLKIKYLLEIPDRNKNTPLHLASLNNHLSIVNLLIDFGAVFNVKNEEGQTALELSCRKGFFEVSKTLINRNPNKFESLNNGETKMFDDPLHVACNEGSYEVVKLMLIKGAPIDLLNSERKNCLDIAVEKEHREVIKVLLRDPNWQKLFNLQNSIHKCGKEMELTLVESPQFNAMYEKKMWDLIRIILDNCRKSEKEFDFKILDPKEFQNVNTHPLTLLAKSGQETLLKHETTLMLLNLKWRIIPRLFFYSSLMLYLLYLVLFSLYVVQIHENFTFLSQISLNFTNTLDNSTQNNTLDQEAKTNRAKRAILKSQSNSVEQTGDKMTSINEIYLKSLNMLDIDSNVDSYVRFYLIIVLVLISFKKFLQILIISRLSFFTNFPDWIEVLTYFLTFITLFLKDLDSKFSFASVSVLLAFFVFLFQIQKLQVFGLFVLAFNKTLIKSATFLPVFLIIYAGFTLSYRMRSQFGVSYYNTQSESLSIIRTFSMITGDLRENEMGIETWSFVNYLLYCLFISIMCIIMLNMLVGIAVGEITTILNEADIQQISMRIIFVMKCQDVLKKVSFLKNKKLFCLRFENYTYNDEYTVIKLRDTFIDFMIQTFSSKDPEIKLDDPQKRLEENLTELARITNDDLKRIRESLTNQINDVSGKLSNSQQRLEDSLLETSRKNVNNLETSKEDSSSQLTTVKAELQSSQNQIIFDIRDLYRHTNIKLIALKQSMTSRFKQLELETYFPHQIKVEKNIEKLLDISNKLTTLTTDEFAAVKDMNKQCLIHMDESLNFNKKLITLTEDLLMINNGLVNQLNSFQIEMFKTSQETKNILEEILAKQIEMQTHKSSPSMSSIASIAKVFETPKEDPPKDPKRTPKPADKRWK